jgi:hypothetical protein
MHLPFPYLPKRPFGIDIFIVLVQYMLYTISNDHHQTGANIHNKFLRYWELWSGAVLHIHNPDLSTLPFLLS